MEKEIPIFIASLLASGVLVYLLWTTRTKTAKAMWGCYLGFFVWGYFLNYIGDSLYRDPRLRFLLGIFICILLGFLAGGIILTFVVSYRKEGD